VAAARGMLLKCSCLAGVASRQTLLKRCPWAAVTAEGRHCKARACIKQTARFALILSEAGLLLQLLLLGWTCGAVQPSSIHISHTLETEE
jgi:hypothetical protein